jgi:Fe2+ or Zn2+ uptake regulation protein
LHYHASFPLRNHAAARKLVRMRKTAKGLPVADQLDWALDFCSAHRMRRTKALRALLSYLLRARRPMSWATLSRERSIAKVCDPSSAFRVLVKLEEIGLVRRMGSPDRSYYFTLTLPGEHSDHLICTGCGKIENLDIKCPVEKLEKRIVTRSGYRSLYHELDFFGICPACQPA